MKFYLFYGLLNIIYPSLLMIILAIARTSGVYYPLWTVWLLGGQILLGIILCCIEENKHEKPK